MVVKTKWSKSAACVPVCSRHSRTFIAGYVEVQQIIEMMKGKWADEINFVDLQVGEELMHCKARAEGNSLFVMTDVITEDDQLAIPQAYFDAALVRSIPAYVCICTSIDNIYCMDKLQRLADIEVSTKQYDSEKERYCDRFLILVTSLMRHILSPFVRSPFFFNGN